MKASDLIHDARFLKPDGKNYCIVIEYGSGQTLTINGGRQLQLLNVSWLAGSTVKSLVRDNRTGAIHFVFAPDRKANPYVHSGVDSFEWVCENVSGDVILG